MRKKLGTVVDERVHRGLSLLAHAEGRSLQALCEEVLASHVERELGDPHVRAAIRARIDRQMAAIGGDDGDDEASPDRGF